ncbi:MAG: class I SAM-dependent methyltransferase [Candidatus Acidiferrales bacterium]
MQLGELHDQAWFPAVFRDGLTDALQSVLNLGAVYAPIAPRLGRAIAACGAVRVVDLCSGGGGPWPWLQRFIGAQHGVPVEVLLTDKYPNVGALERAREASHGAIRYCAEAVDAARVPAELAGFRTMFSSIHHLPPAEVEAVLRDAVDRGQGIGIFDTATRHALTILLTILLPLGTLVTTPFMRPLRWSRIFWTYLMPVIPFVLWFDGVVSCLRAYSPGELREMTARISAAGYTWEIGEESKIRGVLPITYVVGYPKAT